MFDIFMMTRVFLVEIEEVELMMGFSIRLIRLILCCWNGRGDFL